MPLRVGLVVLVNQIYRARSERDNEIQNNTNSDRTEYNEVQHLFQLKIHYMFLNVAPFVPDSFKLLSWSL